MMFPNMNSSRKWATVKHVDCGRLFSMDDAQVIFVRYCPFCGQELSMIRNKKTGEILYEDEDDTDNGTDNGRLN